MLVVARRSRDVGRQEGTTDMFKLLWVMALDAKAEDGGLENAIGCGGCVWNIVASDLFSTGEVYSV